MKLLVKMLMIIVVIGGVVTLAIVCAYWWANVPPKRPKTVQSDAVFLWAGHLGLPAPKRGTWIECWIDTVKGTNNCRLTEMDGSVAYEGVFLSDTKTNPLPQADLKIASEQTSQSVNLWVRVKGQLVPLVFLENGSVLIPKDAYQEGMAKLDQRRQVQRK